VKRNHANQVFKPQTAQAIRIAHILSSYLQLHSPLATASSVNSQNDYGAFTNFGTTLKPDPQLDEHLVIGEIFSTLQTHYPLQEVNVFFNGTEFARQKLSASQNTLAFGVSMIRSDVELLLNRSNDNTHLGKTWYLDAVSRYQYGGGRSVYGGHYRNDFERNYYKDDGLNSDTGSSASNNNNFRIERYSIEMSVRRSFDGTLGSYDLPVKSYDAAAAGVWFGPYYDCQKRYLKTKTTLRLSYSVPVIMSDSKLPM